MNLIVAKKSDVDEIFSLYEDVIKGVSKTSVKLCWNVKSYPSYQWILNAAEKGELLILCQDLLENSLVNKDIENMQTAQIFQSSQKVHKKGKIIGACVVNYDVNREYDEVDWKVKAPKEKISSIHAFCVHPDYWRKGVSLDFLQKVLDYCRKNGDVANHLDVIDTNEKALKLYLKAGYEEIDRIVMRLEVIGAKKFWMMEYIF